MNNYLHDLKITMRPISELKPYQNNARTHSKRQLQQIAESIKTFGFTNPILLDSQNGVIAGHGRIIAAKQLGIESVPTISLEHLSDAQKKAYILADNKLAENAGWDKEILKIEFQNLMTLDLGFNLEITGFETAEIDILVIDEPTGVQDHLPELPQKPVSQEGDLWLLGSHKIYCGSALEKSSYIALFDGSQAQMVFTDPPYNVKVNGHISEKGKHREFAMASGEMSSEEFIKFLSQSLNLLTEFSSDGSIHYICMDWRHLDELTAAASEHYSELKNLCVWNKDNGGMGSLYRSKHELVFVYKNGTAAHINNIELGKHGRYRTNVWDYPGANSLGDGRSEESKQHPTVKPLEMVKDAILDCSKPRGIILDTFGGSGTTLIAAEHSGRTGYLMELDPLYVDLTIKRWEKISGKKAKLANKSLSFKQAQEERHG